MPVIADLAGAERSEVDLIGALDDNVFACFDAALDERIGPVRRAEHEQPSLERLSLGLHVGHRQAVFVLDGVVRKREPLRLSADERLSFGEQADLEARRKID